MTPEQKLRNKFTTTVKSILPKGRYLLQPVETNTVGVPDFYLAWNSKSTWIETKTTDYVVDRFQYSWASRHSATGNTAYILTLIPAPVATRHATSPHPHHLAHQPQHPSSSSGHPLSPSGLYLLEFKSEMLDYTSLGRYITKESPQMRALEDFLLES